MDESKKNLKGSEKRDIFKQKHKNLSKAFWASDADFCWVDKFPPGVVAYLDYKGSGDSITFSEVILYNAWMEQAPVFIANGSDPENGPFTITRYLGGDFHPNPPIVNLEPVITVSGWDEFGDWEKSIRDEYRKRKGWNGNLKKHEGANG